MAGEVKGRLPWMVMAGLIAATAGCGPRGVEYYVATGGNDGWSGKRAEPNWGRTDGPFTSLGRARDAVRQLRSAGRSRGPVTVLVRGGNYFLTNTLAFVAEDSGTAAAPVVYRAFEGERPVLVGGLPVRNFTPHQGPILKADVKSQGLAGVRFRQLLFNGKRQQLARYPNFDSTNTIAGGWAYVAGAMVSMYQDLPSDSRRDLPCRPEDMRRWSHPEEGEVLVFPRHNWWNNLVRIASVDREKRVIHLAANASYALRPGDRYFVRGLLEELDAAGEWCLDAKAGTLYFWPPAPLEGGAVCAPVVRHIVEIGRGAAHIRFRGIGFECCEESAVVLRDAERCRVEGCAIRSVGGYDGSGVWVVGGHGNEVVGCDIADTGSHGIVLGGGDENTRSAAGSRAENNHITRTGVFYKQGAGIQVEGVGNRVARNTIHHVPRWCVGFRGSDHLIELNHMHHASLETEDTGAVYGGSLHWLSGHGVVIRHNFIHDVMGFGRHRDTGQWTSPYFAWGIYLDWSAAGVKVAGNIVARASRGGIMLHDGRDNLVENNIVVGCGEQQIEYSGWTTETGFWTREIDHWVAQYESVRGRPSWHGEGGTLRDPRKAPLPDGHTMHHNSLYRNILVCRNPAQKAVFYRNVSFAQNPSDRNLVWAGGQAVRTGQFRAAGTIGANLAPNPGFEQGKAGETPERWSWHIRPTAQDVARVTDASPVEGRLCLGLRAKPEPSGKEKPSWARTPSFKSADVPAAPGRAYRVVAWIRAARAGTQLEIGAQSYRKGAYEWAETKTVAVDADWSEHEFAFLFPGPGREGYHPEMKAFYLRFRLPAGEGEVWVDDVRLNEAALMDEWRAWQALGMDRNSIVGNPLFLNAGRDDYRLRPESPALKLGFEPIPVERIGCHAGSPRASWPLCREDGVPGESTFQK